MKLIVGLGNPGKEYDMTRHNTGFYCLDVLSDEMNQSIDKEKFKGLYTKFKYKGEDVILLKPQTYMNNSGESVAAVMQFFKIPVEDLLVIYDDMDIGTQNFKRIRVGISKNKLYSVVDWVLGHFSKEEEKLISEGAKRATEAVLCYLDDSFNKAMNKYN